MPIIENSMTINKPNLPTYLSTKTIPNNERLIFALDVENLEKAKKLVEELGDSVIFYKLGLEIFLTGHYFELIDWLVQRGKKIFADLKFFDVPQTVARAVKQLAAYPVTFTTVHGNDAILEAATKVKEKIKVLAVTALTSLDEKDLEDLGFEVKVEDLVLSRSKRAFELGCDGVISSGLEAPLLRDNLEDNFIIITPGIRPVKNTDDQKRTVNVEEAFQNGADYIVVGRPIKEHHGFASPKLAAESIQNKIKAIFNEQK